MSAPKRERDEAIRRMCEAGATDAEIAAAFGVSRTTIRERRVALGLKSKRSPESVAESQVRFRELHAQGLTDQQIADAMGLKKSAVKTRRYAMGLDTNGYQWNTPRITKSRENKVRALHSKGLLDREIGERLGINARQVERVRCRLGLTTNRHKNAVDRAKVLALYDDGLTDKAIALRLGCSSTIVGAIRRKNGLPVNYTPAKASERMLQCAREKAAPKPCQAPLPSRSYVPPNDTVAMLLSRAFEIDPARVAVLTALEPHLAQAMRASA
ncbi:MAG: putative transcription factor D5 [Prokaryotic dsDNA virus sp.]|nr:MAG: putative transcription factor D5 [Prokaryotic dsDNA virus sp.]|tara:strand:+ start:6283 stop:7092 length:810 start_codon:yes stop_codon:yes gene_type:complete